MAADKQVIVFKDAPELARAAAEMIMACARDAITRRGKFAIALSGGSTPEAAYEIIHRDFAAGENWAKWFIFLGDERAVPADDPRSNLGMARRTMLHGLPIPPEHIFPLRTELSLEAAATDYEARIKAFFGNSEPQFDLILLGLGDDGHTASLFPGLPARHEQRKLVTFSPPGTLPPPVDRITFTFPLINLGRKVVFLMAGAKKKSVVRQLLSADVNPELIPAANVHPVNGELVYMMDQAASG
jgi:6-phosphogluconolactonase